MKGKILLGAFLFLFGIGFVLGIPNPAPIYCENMGYTDDGTNCIFGDGNSCESWAFYNGECGAEYIKELSCKALGQSLSPGYECCEGLVSKNPSRYLEAEGICDQIVGSFGICVACGDNECDSTYENKCNCPEDCEKDCPAPNCIGAYRTGEYKDGCPIYLCPTSPNPPEFCDVDQPCPEDFSCVKFPGNNPICVKGDPCENYKCPEGSECAIAETYPLQVICSSVCEGEDCERVVSYTIEDAFQITSIQEISETKSSEENGKIVYIISGSSSGKLFGIIPVKAEIQEKISEQTGKIIEVKKPWWSFLVRGF